MPLYTFHVFGAAGVGSALELAWLADDARAIHYAGELLDRHPTGCLVEAWCDDHRVSVVSRNPAAFGACGDD